MRVATFIVLLSTGFFSCKKKSETPAPSPSTQSISSPWADFNVTRFYEDTLGTSSLSDSSVSAIFYSQAGFNSTNAVNVGNLTLNSFTVPFIPSWYYSVGTLNVSGNLIWSASGTSLFPAFTCTQTSSFPSYTGAAMLQDTVTKNARVTFTINNITGANSIAVLLMHPAAPGGQMKPVINDTVSFIPAEVDYGYNPIALTLFISKQDSVLVNNIFYRFIRGIQYRKVIYLK